MWRQPAYRAFFDAMATRYRFIQFDGRGWGLSSRGLGPGHTMQDRARDLQAVVDRIGLDQFCLISPNHLCHAAVPYVSQQPERVRGLVLWNPGWNQSERGLLLPEEELARRSWELLIQTQAEHFGVGDVELEAKRFRESVTQGDFFAETNAVLQSNIKPYLQALAVPTLILGTRNSLLSPAAEDQWMQLTGLIPGARLVLFDDARMLGGLDTDGGEPSAASAIIDFFEGLPLPDAGDAAPGNAGLSARELEVLRLVAAGKGNQEIADNLVISLNTVRRHVSNVFDKIGASNRTEAAVYARDHSLV
jgi:DNA-binding CsgD family transcriptional regulator/pimeloyl-ACP methyl ester carboxylesterase